MPNTRVPAAGEAMPAAKLQRFRPILGDAAVQMAAAALQIERDAAFIATANVIDRWRIGISCLDRPSGRSCDDLAGVIMNARTPVLQPLGMPKGMDPRQCRQSVEKRLNDLLDRAMSLITALDLMEADCDLEDTADDEPYLGWPDGRPQQGDNDDREGDFSDFEDSGDEHEPSLGWSAGTNQEAALADARADVTFYDGEFDAGDAPEPDNFSETVTWPENLKSQEVLVTL
ncbi:hypothetical protein ACFX5Q_19040 [Mesorhizobium sp. IMUNJ 23033]|uniref:hypothetical protein n=1 Tax=Mesorhizobium sp. IMUNJ 23033 TaxID=3378039 RepID=UPI00384D7497